MKTIQNMKYSAYGILIILFCWTGISYADLEGTLWADSAEHAYIGFYGGHCYGSYKLEGWSQENFFREVGFNKFVTMTFTTLIYGTFDIAVGTYWLSTEKMTITRMGMIFLIPFFINVNYHLVSTNWTPPEEINLIEENDETLIGLKYLMIETVGRLQGIEQE